MSFITWIHYLLGILVGIPKAILGIPKDIVELKKSKLEVTKLKAEERQRDFITPASLNDVGKYDPNVQN